jgi:hypothetical protein
MSVHKVEPECVMETAGPCTPQRFDSSEGPADRNGEQFLNLRRLQANVEETKRRVHPDVNHLDITDAIMHMVVEMQRLGMHQEVLPWFQNVLDMAVARCPQVRWER